MRRAPPMIPPIVQVIQRWRDTSSSISTVSSGERLGSSWRNGDCFSPDFLSRPVSGELADAGLDLVEGDMAETSSRDDLLTIYHDVGDRARRERVDHVLFEGLAGPQRRIVEIECDEVAAIAGADLADREPEDLAGGARTEREAGLGVYGLAV